jgi:hypothetical protein
MLTQSWPRPDTFMHTRVLDSMRWMVCHWRLFGSAHWDMEIELILAVLVWAPP